MSKPNVLVMRQPDSEAVKQFSDFIAGLERDGRVVRSTVMIVAYDEDIAVRVHTNERLSAVVGLCDLSKDVVKDHFEADLVEP